MSAYTRGVGIRVFAAGCAMGVLGCADTTAPSAGGLEGLAFRADANVERPFSGRIEGSVVAIPPFDPGSSPVCNANFSGDPSAPGPSITLVDDAVGEFMHLGHVRLRAVSCIDPASPFSSGIGTITAANGDQLFITFENTARPDLADATRLFAFGSQTVTGGTGRFAQASGSQSCTFTIVLSSAATGAIRGGCTGTLVY